MSAAFDAAGFVAELRAAGLTVWLVQSVPRGGEKAGPPSYFVRSPDGQGLGTVSGYPAVMDRWRDAMEACSDAHDRVVALLMERREVRG